MENYRKLLLLPDPLFVHYYMLKDPIYRAILAKIENRAQLKATIQRARRELSHLIIYENVEAAAYD